MTNVINSFSYNDNIYTFTLPYGVCSTGAGATEKVVTVDNFSLEEGAVVIVKFTNKNDALNPTLNVNGTGAKPIYRYGTTNVSTETTSTGWIAGAIQLFIYDGTGWIRDYWSNTTYSNASLGQGYATCSTAASTKEKTASLSSYSLTTGGIVAVKFTNDVCADATLNINSKGAKKLYFRGAAITEDIIKAGDVATFIYDTNYHLISIDRWQNDIINIKTDIGEDLALKADIIYVDEQDTQTLNSAKAYTDQEVAGLVNSAPETLDTLNELAQALGDDPNFATTVANQIGLKMDKTNPTGTGSFSLNRKANSTIGQNSFAVGTNITASGSTAHAEGSNTVASGYASHAEGQESKALGEGAHAEGQSATASGSYSHAEGYLTNASKRASHAEGEQTLAYSSYQHVQGKFNIGDSTDTYAHIVGNGPSFGQRSNAHTLDWSGNAWYAGDVYVGSTSGKNKDEGSKKLATEEYVGQIADQYAKKNEVPTTTSQLVNDSGFLTDIDKNDIVDAVLVALGTPVFGTLDAENNIVLTGELAEGTYTLKYEQLDGTVSTIGTIEVEGEPTWTNVLPLSVGTDGKDYVGENGEDGYKVNWRYSESSNGEKSATGSTTTGYIPVKKGDIIYLKNVTMNKNNATTQCAAYMFSSLTATGTARVASSLEQWNEPVWDSDGNLLQFKIDSGSDWKYVRLNTSYIGADSIITVNEPIEQG